MRSLAALARAPALAGWELAPRLTLLALLLRPVGDATLRPLVTAAAAAGLLLPGLLRAPALWLALAALAGLRVALDWPMADNHAYLLAYWCLAVGLALRSGDPGGWLGWNAAWLLGLAFAFASAWKLVLSPDYLDGTFFRVFLATDERFAPLVRRVAGIAPGDLAALREALQQHAHLPAPAPPPVPARLSLLAGVATWWTVALELVVAIAFLAPRRSRVAALRDPLLLGFCAVTYAFAPVHGFGWLLLAIGVAQTPPVAGPRRAAYVGAFLLLVLYALLPGAPGSGAG
jgi:hypothetical protein